MKRLRIILQSKYLYIFLILFLFIYVYINVFYIKKESKIEITEKIFYGRIINYYINDNYLSIELNSKEKIKCTYNFKDNKEKNYFIDNYNFGDYVKLMGNLKIPSNNTNINQFNYKNYLYYKNIFYILEINKYEKINNNKNIFYSLKNYLNKRINNYGNSSKYLKAFILGNNKEIDINTRENYQTIGISHLLAISGMHITIFTSLLLFILKKVNIRDTISYIVIIIFLIIYIFITSFSPGILRSSISFILNGINSKLKLNIKSIYLLLITCSIILIFNPFFICNLGFIFSFIISFYLICFSKIIKRSKNYISKLFTISLISFLSSFPIVVFSSYEINILSILYNMFLVPYVSFILFPSSLIVLLIPQLNIIFEIIINIFELLVSIFNSIPSTLILKKPNIFILVSYFIIITLVLYKILYNKKKYIIVFIIMIFLHYNCNYLFPSNYLIMLDVKQGDCILFHSNNKTFIIDTGDSKKDEIINVIKSLGIRKIDYIFITHGDYDHIGNSKYIVNNFKVNEIIFNLNKYNSNEKELINLLKLKNIKYNRVSKYYEIGDFRIHSLNKKYTLENDSSIVFYISINNINMLFTGDISKEVEKYLIYEYKLDNIDILKVSHHGSKYSTSNEFLNETNPKYALISVGKYNKYNHPDKDVVNKLKSNSIDTFITGNNGSIMINFNKSVTFSNYNP